MEDADTTSGSTLNASERVFVRLSVLQTVLALVGILTGAIALYAALNEADAVRKQQKASVYPGIVFAQSYSNDPADLRFSFIVVNNGIGPGRIASMQVTVDEKPVRTWYEMTEAIGADEDIFNRFGQSQIAGRLIRAGETIEALQTTNDNLVTLIVEQRSRIDIDLCYCSVFEECWTPSQSVTEGPTSVEECPAYGDNQFLQ